MKYAILLLLALLPFFAFSQKFHADLFGGIANYQGDLQGKRVTFSQAHPAVGLGASYDLTNKFILRAGFTYGRVGASDQKNTTAKGIEYRNLSFKSDIYEFHLGAEYNIFDLSERSLTPYVFAGIGVFHFDPFTRDAAGNKVMLAPLGTEGQGLAAYPDRKPYRKTQPVIPFGAGVKLALTENLQVGLEIGLRKLFTDYLDDVSTSYADSAALFAGRGAQAVDIAYRGDEVGGPSYPAAGAQRGNPKYKDWYYFTGLRVSYRIGGKRGDGMACPRPAY
jgi:hypothetical protein